MVAPVLFRWLLGLFVKKSLRNGTFFYSNMHQQRRQPQNPYNNSGSQSNGKTRGNVKIDYIPEQPDRKEFNGGEYVDYEEVK